MLIQKAKELAERYGRDISTPFHSTCLQQSLMMEALLNKLGLEEFTIATAIVYSITRYANLDPVVIEEIMGKDIAKLVNSTKKMHFFDAEGRAQNIENLRRLLLAVVEDVRAVLIRLVEYTIELRLCEHVSESLRHQMAINGRDIYAPLANRLGIGQLKWELEDLSFRYLHPDHYQEIVQLLAEKKENREEYVKNAIAQIQSALAKEKITAELTGRVKHVYSIWKKMQRKGINYEEIYDVQGIRILVATVMECYSVLGVIHGFWQHIPKEFDDYIANPKNNGYQALHTAVIGPENKILEIQIRTFEMDMQSELGMAAHWRYKEGMGLDAQYQKQLAEVRQYLKWQDEWTREGSSSLLKPEIFRDRIYILTPKGAVLDLPIGSTVLDFAYRIHTEIGNKCRGAKVNGRIVSLNYSLKNGDQVEIITSKNASPSRDWLNPHLKFLTTARARAKVHHWFKHLDRDKNIVEGRDQLEKELKRLGVAHLNFESLAHQLKFTRVEDMMEAFGTGDMRVTQILSALQALIPDLLPTKAPTSYIKPGSTREKQMAQVTVAGLGNIFCQIARCCKPEPYDNIIGYITLGKGVSIHSQDCVNITRVAHSKLPRLIQVAWVPGLRQ